ncbi:aldehyde dehydrogenase family protein [Deinococcus detaillensis]|uniref:Aldehyde dehydrogenase n=1 Tax=Deinococcus detaillensis TaxID=2592048 RepID=A0A553UZK4_9DEIO|nr:aldehyde dehydrogenase family protein [Deinococcus detaillensis]TSA85618.1 aldehyde dehydrogenase family protein [Deinococcus detaillensis]
MPIAPIPESETSAHLTQLHQLFETHQARRWKAAQSSAAERRALLRQLSDAVKGRRVGLAAALAQDLGKSRAEAEITELHPLLEEIRYARRHLKSWMQPQYVNGVAGLGWGRSAMQPEARGVTLILSPWNYPVNLSLTPLIGALAAGNTAILKPSEKAPATARALSELIAATFSPSLVSVVEGGPDVAEALLELPFDHIFFTGSPAIGRKVLSAAAQTLTSTTLELGGKSPALVDESADLKLAAERIVWGKFLNAGQTCIAPDYVLAHQAIASELTQRLREAIETRYGGPIWQRRGPDYGRMIDPQSVTRLRGLTKASQEAGAELAYGGVFDESERYISPTLVTGVQPDMPLMQQELFGPVLPVVTYQTLDEAIDLIQRHEKPLALYLFTKTAETQRRVERQTSSGSLVVNGTVIQFVHPRLAFGGVGHSGQGSYHGEYSFRAFSHHRAITREPTLSPVRAMYPPYGRVLPRLTAWALRKISE